MTTIDHAWDALVCPVTKTPLIYDRDNKTLISLAARLAYPIRDGIPVMLINEAKALSDDEYNHYKNQQKTYE